MDSFIEIVNLFRFNELFGVESREERGLSRLRSVSSLCCQTAGCVRWSLRVRGDDTRCQSPVADGSHRGSHDQSVTFTLARLLLLHTHLAPAPSHLPGSCWYHTIIRPVPITGQFPYLSRDNCLSLWRDFSKFILREAMKMALHGLVLVNLLLTRILSEWKSKSSSKCYKPVVMFLFGSFWCPFVDTL